ncbi:MAG: mechanosensitive ion channel [Clostridiales bacterium]|nr:mechanosensitive ion channel [Clostridiales bacterium]
MSFITQILNPIINSIPTVLQSILLILLGIVVALVVRGVILKVGGKLKFEEKLDKIGLSEATSSSLKFLANFAAVLIFILFVPGILGHLGLETVIAPINSMMTNLLSYIPQILGAAVILAVGYFVARIIKQIVTALLKKTKLDSLQEKLGAQTSLDSAKFSVGIGNIVFALIFIPIVISALDVLRISSISQPAIGMLTAIFNIIPNIFVAIILIGVGIMIAKLVYSVLSGLLTSIGTDNAVKKIVKADNAEKFSLVKIITEAVRFIIIILFTVQAFNVLNLDFMSNVGEVIVSYLPSLIFAFVILIVGYLFGSWLKSVIDESTNSGKTGFAAKSAILVLTGFIILNQLGFAMVIVNTVFLILIGALALTFAIAFGVGGRDFAARLLSKAEDKLSDKQK